MTMIEGQTNTLVQWEYTSQKKYSDPFNDIELDVKITSSTGVVLSVLFNF